jgi:hypothetical protein
MRGPCTVGHCQVDIRSGRVWKYFLQVRHHSPCNIQLISILSGLAVSRSFGKTTTFGFYLHVRWRTDIFPGFLDETLEKVTTQLTADCGRTVLMNFSGSIALEFILLRNPCLLLPPALPGMYTCFPHGCFLFGKDLGSRTCKPFLVSCFENQKKICQAFCFTSN